MRILFLSMVLILFSQVCFCQIILKGFVKDKEGRPIEAVIVHSENKKALYSTSANGYFEINTQASSHICFSKTGYLDTCIISSKYDTSLLIILKEKIIRAEDVYVYSKNSQLKSINNSKAGVMEIRTDNVLKLPTLGGEADPLRILQLTPGITKSEFSMGLIVRGGTNDQNLIILDDGMLYNPSHLAGFVSVFNPFIIDKTTLIKSGVPVEYGGRSSSLLIVESSKKDYEHFTVDGNIGLLMSNIAIHSPVGEKCQVSIAFRRSYLDQTIKPASKELFPHTLSFFNNSSYSFYDANFSIKYTLSARDVLFISAYTGNDDFTERKTSFDLDFNLKWGNQMASAKWTHIFSSNHIAKTTFYYTGSNLSIYFGQQNFNYQLTSKNEDFSLKHEHQLFGNKYRIKTGVQVLKQLVIPNKSKADLDQFVSNFGTPNEYHLLTESPYIDCEYQLNQRNNISVGLRYNFYQHLGPYYRFHRSFENKIDDTLYYSTNSLVKSFIYPDIQISFRHKLDSLSAIKAQIGRNVQFIQQVNVTSVAIPTDFWMPASLLLSPMNGYQISMGYYNEKFINTNISFELFYKWADNVTEFKKGLLQSIDKASMEENIITGKARSYGMELYMERDFGKLHGWISYTLSKSLKIFKEINNGKPFPSKYDRCHDLSLSMMYKINNMWNASMIFTYASGQAVTIPVARYMINENIINEYSGYNSSRMPPYHRMDVAINRLLSKKNGKSQELVFSIYNVYGRLNPYFMYFKITGDLKTYQLKVTPKYVSLFPMLPSISYRFSF
jgi:hypothetical protein